MLNEASSETSPTIEDNHTNNNTAKRQPKSNSRNETTVTRQLSHQINELAETNATIEQHLLSIKNDIKQMTKTDDDNLANDGRSIKQIQSHITQLQMHVAKIEKGIGLLKV